MSERKPEAAEYRQPTLAGYAFGLLIACCLSVSLIASIL